MSQPFKADFIIDSFALEGTYKGFSVKNDGNINSTFVISLENGAKTDKYTLQKINTNVFRRPDELMRNLVGVTAHIKQKGGMQTLDFMPCRDGKYYCVDGGDYWRCYRYIDNVYTCNIIDSPDVFRSAGQAFGKFQSILSDYPIDSLFDTIPDFHNTAKRFETFKKSVAENRAGRAAGVRREIDFILSREDDMSRLTGLLENGILPLRVTHNDTKLNNILFDEKTNEGVCIIDLDTVMPGLSLYDFGDSIRFGANTAAEDERDTSKISLNLDLYRAYTEGYLSAAGSSLTDAEIEYLPFSAKLMTLELAMRFLTDYLDGDVYFKLNYPEHNLVRTRAQQTLVSDIEKKLDQMKTITANAVK